MSYQPFSLQGKVALVTGATSGIGRAIAVEFHKMGATVIASGTREAQLQELESELGTRIFVKPCNLADENETANLVATAVEVAGSLDILVSNAGVTKDGLAIRMSLEDFDQVININLRASFILNREAVKVMMKKRYGRIINISSVVAFSGNPGQANYCASKAGLIGMMKSMTKEVAQRGITINSIAPGFIDTPMTAGLKEEWRAKLLESIPTGRFGLPEDIAAAALYLASDQASYVNGQVLHVNGGMYL